MQILTQEGYKDASLVQVGDGVVAYDMESGQPILNTVKAIEYIVPDPDLDIDPKTFYTINGLYRFYANQSIWVNGNVVHVSELQIGDTIYDDNDQDLVITSIVSDESPDGWWRLQIEIDHSYIADGISLHNASRYWVGGGSSVNWNATSNTNWSATSGGANNASVPGSADAAFLDGVGSGASDGTISAFIVLKSLDFTGYVNTVTHNASIVVAMNGTSYVTFSAGMTYILGNSATSSFLGSGVGTVTVTTNGKTIGNFLWSGDTLSLGSDLVSSGTMQMGNNSVYNGNGFNLTTLELGLTGATNRTVNMGAGTITLTGTGTVWEPFDTVTASTSTIVISNTSATSKTFSGNGKTYNNLTITGDNVIITGANTFNVLAINNAGLTTGLTLPASTTTTVTNVTSNGTAGSLTKLISSSAGTAATISSSSVAVIQLDYMSIKDITTAGTAKWFARSTTNVSGNTGWTFNSQGNMSWMC